MAEDAAPDRYTQRNRKQLLSYIRERRLVEIYGASLIAASTNDQLRQLLRADDEQKMEQSS